MEVKVRVRAGARREVFEMITPISFTIAVREEAAKNAANRRVIERIAAYFKVPIKTVRIIRGHRSPSKTLSVG
ncbi:hypothetical protein A2853_00205 [Candidatus Kaiserbacteria bacterium RIFCSPHIGHO2_01_FULL_55_17]|uniref:Uncharacterized protein n=1 Tax=Candidatus Kaiserbacteria bacterium RIFCSPHIGHO2_01_FULL_55_17 TaxID=1798484 RepID=A0A1F6DA62_9BACT|nr:MAG: hypothetical protein A2853_00205 [Candidatus Kaiserbacteria bacterium RIFCSPHIGHO2_01_FULL_55_17]